MNKRKQKHLAPTSAYVKWTNQYVNAHLKKKWTDTLVHLYKEGTDVFNNPDVVLQLGVKICKNLSITDQFYKTMI